MVSIDVRPHTPQLELAAAARSSLDTSTVDRPRQLDVDPIATDLTVGRLPVADALNVESVSHQPLGQEKPGREIEVVAWCPHRDTCRLTVDTNLQWLFDGELIEHRTMTAVVPLNDLR